MHDPYSDVMIIIVLPKIVMPVSSACAIIAAAGFQSYLSCDPELKACTHLKQNCRGKTSLENVKQEENREAVSIQNESDFYSS